MARVQIFSAATFVENNTNSCGYDDRQTLNEACFNCLIDACLSTISAADMRLLVWAAVTNECASFRKQQKCHILVDIYVSYYLPTKLIKQTWSIINPITERQLKCQVNGTVGRRFQYGLAFHLYCA